MVFSFLPTVITIVLCLAGCYGDHKAKRYQVNLDLAPEERWKPVLEQLDVKQIKGYLTDIVSTYMPKELIPVLDILVQPLEEFVPQPFAGEIKGIAKYAGLGVGEVLGINIIYDVTAFCTSIVAENTDGTIWHGRNLDYPLIKELLNMTIVVDYMRGGKVEYTTTSFAGQVGVFTGMRPYAFTSSMNERDRGNLEDNIFALVKALLLKRGSLTTFEMRQVLHEATSYAEAVDRFANDNLVAPVYIIVGGTLPGEGVVITRDQERADLWELNGFQDRWFLLETNYDHWTTPPSHDDRRDPGIKAMNKVGQSNINKRTLFEVLSTSPVLNGITVYTAIMSAAQPDEFETVIRS